MGDSRLWSCCFLHVTVFLGFTDSLFSSLVVVVVVVEAGTGTGRVGQGGNTKNRVGEGEMVLIHTRSRREGGELCLFH